MWIWPAGYSSHKNRWRRLASLVACWPESLECPPDEPNGPRPREVALNAKLKNQLLQQRSIRAPAPHNVKPSVKIVEVVKRDTVFVASQPDTIVKDRIIYRTVFKRERNSEQIHFATKVEHAPVREHGVNMKEKQDLALLLVAGSR